LNLQETSKATTGIGCTGIASTEDRQREENLQETSKATTGKRVHWNCIHRGQTEGRKFTGNIKGNYRNRVHWNCIHRGQTEGGKFQNICEVNSLSKFFKCYFFENENYTRPPSRALYSVASRGSDSNNTRQCTLKRYNITRLNISHTECSSGTNQKLPFGLNTLRTVDADLRF